MRLENRVAVITGAAAGIGRACAIVFAKEGARIAAGDINENGGKETVAMIKASGGEAIFVPTDVSSAAAAENLIKQALGKFGKIDILLNVAGIVHSFVPLEEISEEEWDRVYAVNVKGMYHTMKYAIPLMKKQRSGAIVNVASIGGLHPLPNGAAYTSSKGAIITLSKAAAVELVKYNVRVNSVLPSGTDTALATVIAPPGADPEKTKKELASHIPLGRFIKPEEIAYAALYLASDEALMLSGTQIVVNAGIV